MSLIEIENELKHLTPEELRHLALRSWSALVEKEGDLGDFNECDEDDPSLLSALDEAVLYANSSPNIGCTAVEVRERISEWTSK